MSGFISDNDETSYRAEVDSLTNYCKDNNLLLNVTKTKEMIIDFRRNKTSKEPLYIDDEPVEIVNHFKLLGSYVSNDLKWHLNCSELVKKARQRLFFLRKLKSFTSDTVTLMKFYRAIIESILTSSIIVWFGNATQKDISKMISVIHSAQKIIGMSLPSLESIYNDRLLSRTKSIVSDNSHPAHEYFELLPSGKRYRNFYGNKRYVNSTFPAAVKAFNINCTHKL